MNLGYVKFRITRLQSYGTIVATVIQVFGAFKILDLSFWWLLVGIPFLWVIHLIDKKYVHPKESGTMFADNIEWQELMRMMREVHKNARERDEQNKRPVDKGRPWEDSPF